MSISVFRKNHEVVFFGKYSMYSDEIVTILLSSIDKVNKLNKIREMKDFY